MIEDVYEPLGRYAGEFRRKFAGLAGEKFDELTRLSGIDVEANRALAAQTHALERKCERAKTRKSLIAAALAFAVAGALACAFAALLGEGGMTFLPPWPAARYWAIAAASAALAAVLGVLCRDTGREVEALEARIAEGRRKCGEQMAPLNALFTWDIPVKLVEETVPRLRFDAYFTEARLAELVSDFDWDAAFNYGKSIVCAQSGTINGNPFVFAHYVEQDWDEKTYTGTKTISWTETVRDANGKLRRVRRTQTLVASVTKPVPVYPERKVLIYGNEAAPDLSFTHSPSGLNGEGGFFNAIKKAWRLRRLKAFSRNLKDESQFTLMGNHEFETWFHAKDRDNEVEFRLLFTPMAQTQMLKLMKDSKTGFGDDFELRKRRRLNIVEPEHLAAAPIDTDPRRYRGWDWQAVRENFLGFTTSFFKNVYFSFAPLLAIPLYQQTRTHRDIWREALGAPPACFWEHEAAANLHGDRFFRAIDCATRCILKTRVVSRGGGESDIAVTAHGFKGVKRVERKSVYGGDGKWHDIAVEWIEYVPVANKRGMKLVESSEPPQTFLDEASLAGCSIAATRSISSFVNR